VNIEALRRYGIPERVIERWQADGIRFLLPLQVRSVTRHGILEGKSLIVGGPGTSGKTFCGEIAALYQAARRKKAVFLVPLKAIAEERYKLFARRYSQLGLKVRLATRDFTDHDRHISSADFDILITIYEKFNSLTATDVSLVRNCGCFVLDEFQMITDAERGMEIEILIAKIMAFGQDSQIVILMGGGSSCQEISDWLDIPVLEETRRPVDLRLGVLHRGTFHYRGFNDLNEGDERWLEERKIDYDGPLDDQTFAAIEALAARAEQVLIFTSSRNKARIIALHLASLLDLQSCTESLKSLTDLPPSIQNEDLGRCLSSGVAFHHAELDSEQRELVENGFRSGEIRVLCATSTLAWGVNLPVKNVFVETVKYDGPVSRGGRRMPIPLSAGEFQQAAGRAGRLGAGEKFGRAVMVASTPYEQEILWNQYVYSVNESPASVLDCRKLPDIILRLLACEIGSYESEIFNVIGKTYVARFPQDKNPIEKMIKASLNYLVNGGLGDIDRAGSIRPTNIGRIACETGFSSESIIAISDLLEQEQTFEPLEWLFLALELREWKETCGPFFVARFSVQNLIDEIDSLGDGILERSTMIRSHFDGLNDRRNKERLVAFLFALAWISGRPTRDLEKVFRRGTGGLKRDASTLSWIIMTIGKMVNNSEASGSIESSLSRELQNLALRLRYGVDAQKLSLALILDIDREFIRRLHDTGIRSVHDLRDLDYSVSMAVLPVPVVEKIRKRMQNYQPEAAPTICNITAGADNRIVFTGNNRRLLKEVIILDKSVYLQPKLYSYLQKLWWAGLSDDPWVYKEALEPGFNQAKYVSKLRRSLSQAGANAGIISDGRGSYRLVLPEGVDCASVGGDDQHIGVNGGR
jgi:helicase